MIILFTHLLWIGMALAEKEPSANPNTESGLIALHEDDHSAESNKSMLAASKNSDSSSSSDSNESDSSKNGDSSNNLCMKCYPLGIVTPPDECEKKAAKIEHQRECKARYADTARVRTEACCSAQKACPYSCGAANGGKDNQSINQPNPSRYPDVQPAS